MNRFILNDGHSTTPDGRDRGMETEGFRPLSNGSIGQIDHENFRSHSNCCQGWTDC
uniref:Uncharacterized protein n=1 Tax=Pristionchus pacificus TaxID=54126 RepID=A0A2A6C548_PRIPA|eukprot:PDM73236.1 hypothetical protein PRIPAC_40592 [Pristionchus pacificus]